MRIIDGVQTCALPICEFSWGDGKGPVGRRPAGPFRLNKTVTLGLDPRVHVERRRLTPPWIRARARLRSLVRDDSLSRRQGSANGGSRSEEHTSDLLSLMRTPYAVFCLEQRTQNKMKSQRR